ncbi:MAG: hypothetical protein H0V62_05335, partial [Gammaproteobacteria bacterium]|nr:hypothetical protein [Gammaproteobacteria bacterium]
MKRLHLCGVLWLICTACGVWHPTILDRRLPGSPGETRADYTQHVAVSAFTGSYFDSKNFTNRKMTRVDDAIDFNWGKGSPSSLMSRDSFSIRWVGNFVFQEG